MSVQVIQGDCIEVLRSFRDRSVDAVVTDPPYGMSEQPDIAEVMRHWIAGDRYEHGGGGFMGKTWDSFVPGPEYWREVYRVLKPGGYLLSFASTRTYDLMSIAIRFAAFEVRDMLSWLYGSGFPKSLNVGDGRGTALKPACEPIVFARKPLDGTVAANTQKWGTGAINIDACRVGGDDGRWPANVLFDKDAAAQLDEQTGKLKSGTAPNGLKRNGDKFRRVFSEFAGQEVEEDPTYGDSGGASRFFYVAKTAPSEREAGLDYMPKMSGGDLTDREDGSAGLNSPRAGAGRHGGRANNHPTVKPIKLMRYLIRLVTPPGGVVLDPFAGSGTTGCAAAQENVNCILIEREAEYVEIARARIAYWSKEGGMEGEQRVQVQVAKKIEVENANAEVQDNEQFIGRIYNEQGEDDMAFLPKGFGREVAKAEATIPRQRLKDGDYIFLHKSLFLKDTQKGEAVIIEHKIVEAKAIKEGVEPTPVGTSWGYFLPKYGDAAVMLRPNLKAYTIGLLGLDEKKVTEDDFAEAFDEMGSEGQAARGMLVRGVTFHTNKEDGGDFMGVNWFPVAGENVFRAPSVLARRAEIESELGGTLPNTTKTSAAPSVPRAPTIPTAPVVAIPAGWQPHPTEPPHPVNGPWFYRGNEVKTQADLIAGR